jgi:dihydrofolate synthase/folylpolyglutamate synthase
VSPRPWTLHFTPSAWEDPLDDVITALMPDYNAGVPRQSLDGVRALLDVRVPHHVVVVGTNGKSSVATYIARLLTAAGHRTGLYTSPHLRFWNERIQVDLEPVAELEAALRRRHEQARGLQDVRFFDVLTAVAEDLFADAGVEYGVFESGIGGRLDATRALEPELVVLTSIGEDHEALLGSEPAQRLFEKALATPPGATLVAAPLGEALDLELDRLAGDHGFRVLRAEPVPGHRAMNVALAQLAVEVLGVPPAPFATEVDGRLQRGTVRGVPYVLDVAHNPTAWAAFLDELPDTPHVVLCAITEPREPGRLVETLAAAHGKVAEVVVTTTTVRPARDPEALAAALRSSGLPATAAPRPEDAFALAFAPRGLPVAVFGSNYLIVDVLAWLQSA